MSNLEWATQSRQCEHSRSTQEKYTNHIDRKVVLLDKNGKIIKSWKNGEICGLEYGVTRKTIVYHCNKKDIWRDLRLRYKDEL